MLVRAFLFYRSTGTIALVVYRTGDSEMDGPLISLPMLRERRIHVIGTGSLGGRCIESLCRFRVPEVIAHDFDRVETHNRYNQVVFKNEIGKKKADVFVRRSQMIDPTGTRVVPRYRRVDGRTKLSGFVFVMVDTMRDRKTIWNKCIKNNPNVTLMIEARMGVSSGRIYAVDPNNEYHIHMWERHSAYEDGPDVLAGCKAEYPAPSTADIIAGEAIWRFLNWLQFEQGSGRPYYNYIGFNQFAVSKGYQNQRKAW